MSRVYHPRSRLCSFREQVLMLAVADDEHAFAVAFAYYKVEPSVRGIDGDEGDGAVVVLPRRDRALPLAEIESDDAILAEYLNITQLLAGVMLRQLGNKLRVSRHYQPLTSFGQ